MILTLERQKQLQDIQARFTKPLAEKLALCTPLQRHWFHQPDSSTLLLCFGDPINDKLQEIHDALTVLSIIQVAQSAWGNCQIPPGSPWPFNPLIQISRYRSSRNQYPLTLESVGEDWGHWGVGRLTLARQSWRSHESLGNCQCHRHNLSRGWITWIRTYCESSCWKHPLPQVYMRDSTRVTFSDLIHVRTSIVSLWSEGDGRSTRWTCRDDNGVGGRNGRPAAGTKGKEGERLVGVHQQARKLKFRLRKHTSCFCYGVGSAASFEGRVAGLDATERGNELSQPTYKFTSL